MGKKHLKIQQHNHESSMIIFPDGTSIIQNDKKIDKLVKKWTKLEQNRHNPRDLSGAKWCKVENIVHRMKNKFSLYLYMNSKGL